MSSLYKVNNVSDAIRLILPAYSAGIHSSKIRLTNYLLDRSYYIDISNSYSSLFITKYYGIYNRLSKLYIYTCGLNIRTPYFFASSLFDINVIVNVFSCINKNLFHYTLLSIKKKFSAHTY